MTRRQAFGLVFLRALGLDVGPTVPAAIALVMPRPLWRLYLQAEGMR